MNMSEIELHLIMLDVRGHPHLKLAVNITESESEIQHTFYEYLGQHTVLHQSFSGQLMNLG